MKVAGTEARVGDGEAGHLTPLPALPSVEQLDSIKPPLGHQRHHAVQINNVQPEEPATSKHLLPGLLSPGVTVVGDDLPSGEACRQSELAETEGRDLGTRSQVVHGAGGLAKAHWDISTV